MRAAERTEIVIVGAGFAGLGMAIRLAQAGIEDFVVLEQGDGIGGTWRVNRYPGAACDVESHLYSFSFAPNPDWSRRFAPQQEILDYLERCADEYGLRPRIRLQTAVTSAAFDEQRGLWSVETSDGHRLEARVLVAGCGGLSRPANPEIAGLEDFAGRMFHSARWDDGVALEGKRVGVIGTGASAIQIVPAIAPQVSALEVFQRTPPWIVAKPDAHIDAHARARYRRWPALQRAARYWLYWQHELLVLGFVVNPRLMKLAERFAIGHLRNSVDDPELRRKLTPSYALGCKRILLSNDYYPALRRPNVSLVTERIHRVVAEGIRTDDGRVHELDAIVLATGFQAAEAVAPFPIRGLGGRDLTSEWGDGAEAYLGTTVSGFPNLFVLVGPNTGLGHSSMVFMIESQIHYALGAIRLLRERGLGWLNVEPEKQRDYNRALHARLDETVWATGCSSWYRTRSGKNTTLWPGFTFDFWRRTRRFDSESYALAPQPVVEREGAAVRRAPSPIVAGD